MKISDIEKTKGYKTDTCRICEFLGFDDTDQLKGAKFFSQEESYSPIPFIGWSMSNGDMTWRVCQVVDSDQELYSVDYGYKLILEICDGTGQGRHKYYQSDFYSLLQAGLILPYEEGKHIEHIKWMEPLTDYISIVHEADAVV